jgi:hypothetical protein
VNPGDVREVRVRLRVFGGGAPPGDEAPLGVARTPGASASVAVFADEHLSVRWNDDGRGGPWRDSADVLWRGSPAPSRAAAYAWSRETVRRHPGVLVVCAGYGDGPGRCLVVRTGAPPLTAYITGGGAGAVAAAGSLLHACVTARLPLDRPLRALTACREPDGGDRRWAVHLVPGPDAARVSGASSATRAASRPASGAPTPS